MCTSCLEQDISSYYCGFCHTPASRGSEKNRCQQCYECPSCSHTLSVKQADYAGSPVVSLFCEHCDWRHQSARLSLVTSYGLSPHKGTSYSGAVEAGSGLDSDPRAAARFVAINALLKEQRQQQMESSKRILHQFKIGLMPRIVAPSPANALGSPGSMVLSLKARLEGDELNNVLRDLDALQASKFKVAVSTAPIENKFNSAQLPAGIRGHVDTPPPSPHGAPVESPPSPTAGSSAPVPPNDAPRDAKPAASGEATFKTTAGSTTLSQRLAAASRPTRTTQLLPRHRHLLVKTSARCQAYPCTKFILKPTAIGEGYDIDQVAIKSLPLLTLAPPSSLRVLPPLSDGTSRLVLFVANPLPGFDMRVTLTQSLKRALPSHIRQPRFVPEEADDKGDQSAAPEQAHEAEPELPNDPALEQCKVRFGSSGAESFTVEVPTEMAEGTADYKDDRAVVVFRDHNKVGIELRMSPVSPEVADSKRFQFALLVTAERVPSALCDPEFAADLQSTSTPSSVQTLVFVDATV